MLEITQTNDTATTNGAGSPKYSLKIKDLNSKFEYWICIVNINNYRGYSTKRRQLLIHRKQH